MPRPLPYLARRRFIAVVFAGCLVAIGIPGCRRGPDLHAITGVVRFKGQPVAGATVGFSGRHPETGRPVLAVGTTDVEGRYSLATRFSPRSSPRGVVAGEHRVTVEKMVPPQSMTEEEFARRSAAGEPIQLVPLFDTKYFSGDTTPLSAEVREGGPLEFSFDIE
jgi:hypothetical protein